MAKASFSKLKIKLNIEVDTFEWNGVTVEVKQYLSADNKRDLVDIALQKTKTNGLYHPVLLTAYTALNIVYLYTNVDFTEKQKEDELKLYDMMYSSGFLDEVMNRIPFTEIDAIEDFIEIRRKELIEYTNSFGGIFKTFVDELPQNAESAVQAFKELDTNKMNDLLSFVKNTNGVKDVLPSQSIQDKIKNIIK